jgi:hypothetical protein
MPIKKIFRSLGVVALGILIAQLATVMPAQAQGDLENPGEGDNTCAPRTNHVCGLNGQNYMDKRLLN